MKSVQKSVIISGASLEIFKRHSKEKIRWSNLVNKSVGAAHWLSKACLPEFSHEEWEEILNTYSGSLDYLDTYPYRVASDMMDHYGVIEVKDHRMPSLIRKIHSMGQCEQFAILSAVNEFWSKDWDDKETFTEVMKEIKEP